MTGAAIVLCGGNSRRMGSDKASLPFGDETLLERVVGRLRSVVDEVVVVARADQEIAGDFVVARDAVADRGPVAGIAAGLAATSADRAFVTACDAPFLEPALVRLLLDLSAGHDVAVPFVDGYLMTLAAVYGKSALPVARRLLEAGDLRVRFIIDALSAREVSEDEVRAVDPDLASFVNCNTPKAYREALARLG